MSDILQMHLALEARVGELEEHRGTIAADISALRTEVRTNATWIKESLARIEEKLEDRPSRTEMASLNGTGKSRRSLIPRIVVDAKNKRVSLVNVSGWLVFALAIVVGAVIALWLKK